MHYNLKGHSVSDMRTYTVDRVAVETYIRAGLDCPTNLAAHADGLRARVLGPLYFERPDSVFWHELPEHEKAPWIEKARVELEAALVAP